jgi:hypothetical protein
LGDEGGGNMGDEDCDKGPAEGPLLSAGTHDSFLTATAAAVAVASVAKEASMGRVDVEFDGAWLPAVKEEANPWSTCFRFADGSTAQVRERHLLLVHVAALF